MFNVCTIDQAKQLIYDKFSNYHLEIEEVSILNALNRYLAEDITAKCDVPHFNRSTVDGYAVISKDVEGASESLPAYLKLVGKVEMGKPCDHVLTTGEAIYVPTGGALPDGSNSVVMIEDTDEINEELFVYKRMAPRENILFRGEDIEIGQVVLKRGKKITPQDLGVLTSIGYNTVKVYKKIKFTVISTGDEIVAPDQNPNIGEVRDINSYTISGVIKEKHGELIDLFVIRDDVDKLKQTMIEAIEKSDVIVISGGSSVGQKDFTYQLLDEIEKDAVFIHGIAIKPGKPTIFAKVNHKLVFGLPGQPASALVVFKTFIDDIEQALYGGEIKPAFYIEAKLTNNVRSTPGRQTYQMVKLIKTNDGYLAQPIYGKSGTISLIANANGYIIISANLEGVSANDLVKVYEM